MTCPPESGHCKLVATQDCKLYETIEIPSSGFALSGQENCMATLYAPAHEGDAVMRHIYFEGGGDIKMPIDIKITNIIFSVETEYNNAQDIPDNGGSIFLAGPSEGGPMITFKMTNVLFKGLRSKHFGGAVCVGGNVQVELDDVRFEDCIETVEVSMVEHWHLVHRLAFAP